MDSNVSNLNSVNSLKSVDIANSVQAIYGAALPRYLMVFFIQTTLLIMPHPQLFGQKVSFTVNLLMVVSLKPVGRCFKHL